MLDNNKQEELNNLLKELNSSALNNDQITGVWNKLKSIYDGDFRHSYSQIFAALVNDVRKVGGGQFEFLTLNLEEISKHVHSENLENDDKKFIEKFEKLHDHVMLDTTRLGYFDNIESRYSDVRNKLISTKTELQNLVDKSTGEFDSKSKALEESVEEQVNKSLNSAKIQIDSLRTESITVLSILSAVILSGVGGFAAISSIFNNIHQITMYVFFACAGFLGMILFNVIFMLIYMIARLTGRSIYTVCDEDCAYKEFSERKCYNGPCSAISRIRKRIPYVFWFNIISGVVILSSLCIEYLVMKYQIEDWLLILLAYLLVSLSVYYGIKNSKI